MNFYAFLPKLLNMSLTASIAIVCVLLLRLLLKKAPKVISYALWAVVLFRLLCPISISSNFSLFGFMDLPITDTATRTSSIEYVPEDIVHTEVPEVTIPVPGVSETINNALPEGREQLTADPLEVPVAIGTYVWLAGVLAMAGYSVVSYVRLKKKLLIVSPLHDNIYLADEITTPFVMGLIRPKIYLPSDMEEGQQSYIILHEQHHIRRGDHIIKALAFLALSIHWFNPLAWVAFLYSNKDMEMSCDEAVVKKLGDGILADYTASLLSLATGKRIIAGMPLAFGEGDTKGRIRNLANWKKPAFWVVLVAVISCIALGIGLLTNPTREYQIRITIPAGSTAAFCYSDEEISPQRTVLTLANGEGLGDTEVILLPVEVREENIYEPTYMTPGMPVKMDVEKGAWYKIGVNMQNPTTEDIDVYVSVENVEVRIAERDDAGTENDVYGDIVAGLGEQETGTVMDAEDPELNEEGVYDELVRVVSSVGLENAFPWNNTVNLKENADALIQMASDETGRFEIYGIMSEKYGTYGLLLNDWIGGQENWNFAYVPWMYSGAPSQQPILEPDGKGAYIFAYIYEYDDVPHWRECVLDCGYDTGHMELLSQEDYAKKYGEQKEDTEKTGEEIEIPGEDVDNPAAGIAMVDAAAITSIVVINGNTGDRKTLTAEDTYPYQDLTKLYRQLDFTAECEENTRIGYQYCMKLQDAEGNTLQTVTPYKDGMTVDRIFFQYDNTGDSAAASLRLMDYLEYLFNPE